MYTIVYQTLVIKEDFKKHSTHRQKILRAIHKKLTVDPIAFGKPLTGQLKGYFRLRVGEFRVIYKVEKQVVTVFVVKIGLRKDALVYLETARRLGL